MTALQLMKNPYRRDTKLHRIYAFMQDGCWHTLKGITEQVLKAKCGLSGMGYQRGSRSRVASALRTIRSHPDLSIEYDGERYCMELQPLVRSRSRELTRPPSPAFVFKGFNGA